MPEAEVKTVTGICAEIAQKPGNDWVEFHVDSGGKYPVKLSTKLQPLIELGKAAGQNLATWTYKEVDSGTPNPHKPGTNFVNKYLEKVEVGGTQEAPQNGPSANEGPAAPAHKPLIAGDKDRAITRMAVLRTAASLIEPGDDIEGIGLQTMKLAQRFESWVYRDIEPPPFQ